MTRIIALTGTFSLVETCGPITWGKDRWPNVGWSDGAFTWVGWENDQVVWRVARQLVTEPDQLIIDGTASPDGDVTWAERCLGIAETQPIFSDPVLQHIQQLFPGLRPYASGSLFEGLISSIAGQSISVAAAAVTQKKLAALFHDGIDVDGRRYLPFPRADQLAEAEFSLVRESGVTWRRAQAIVQAGRATVAGSLPSYEQVCSDPDVARIILRTLPLVGPWTVESSLLWGLGIADAHPSGDVALLRAVRAEYERPEMTLKDLDVLAADWVPARAWAARLLWTKLLGPAV